MGFGRVDAMFCEPTKIYNNYNNLKFISVNC